MKTQNYSKIVAYLNPFFLYYSVIYCTSKVVETILGTESVWQICWDKIRYTFGDDKGSYIIWVMNIYTTALYWVLGFALIAMDKYKRPKFLENYKIQSKQSEIEQGDNLFKVIKTVFRNQTLAFILAVIVYKIDNNFLGISISPEVPSFFTTMCDLLACFFCHEIFFYYSHRMLHHKWFYRLHKQHHEYITPVCISAEYCGIIEHIFSNIIPVIIGFRIMKTHITTALLWLTIVIITTLNDHSGYHLPFMHSSELHDYHHLKFNVNFSVYGFLDKIHGTYGHFEKSKNYENHKTLFSLSPVKK